MKPTTMTGYVPVKILLPAELADKFEEMNLNWSGLAKLFTVSLTPEELADFLLNMYFDYTRLLALVPEEITPNTVENLYSCQQIIRAVKSLNDAIPSSDPAFESEEQ